MDSARSGDSFVSLERLQSATNKRTIYPEQDPHPSEPKKDEDGLEKDRVDSERNRFAF